MRTTLASWSPETMTPLQARWARMRDEMWFGNCLFAFELNPVNQTPVFVGTSSLYRFSAPASPTGIHRDC